MSVKEKRKEGAILADKFCEEIPNLFVGILTNQYRAQIFEETWFYGYLCNYMLTAM